MLIVGQLGREVVGGYAAVELLLQSVHGGARLDLDEGQDGPPASRFDGSRRSFRVSASANARRTARPRWGSTRGSGSISLSAATAFAWRSAASFRRRASSSAALAVVVGLSGRGSVSRTCWAIWPDSSFIVRRTSSNFWRVGSCQRQMSGSSFASRSSACRAPFLASSITWGVRVPSVSTAHVVLFTASRAASSGNFFRPSLPSGGLIVLASRAIASSRRARYFIRAARAAFSSAPSLSLLRTSRRASSI